MAVCTRVVSVGDGAAEVLPRFDAGQAADGVAEQRSALMQWFKFLVRRFGVERIGELGANVFAILSQRGDTVGDGRK